MPFNCFWRDCDSGVGYAHSKHLNLGVSKATTAAAVSHQVGSVLMLIAALATLNSCNSCKTWKR